MGDKEKVRDDCYSHSKTTTKADALGKEKLQTVLLREGVAAVDGVEQTFSQLNSSRHDDSEECKAFAVRKEVLDPSRPFHVPAVDERQQPCVQMCALWIGEQWERK